MSAHPALAAGRVPAGERAAGKTTLRFPAVRYLVLSRSSSPVGVINDRAVGLAERSRLGEAEVLFREALAEDPGLAAASNNLGVVCELTGRRAEAFGHYAAACLRERDNALFRSNFLGFADRRADGE